MFFLLCVYLVDYIGWWVVVWVFGRVGGGGLSGAWLGVLLWCGVYYVCFLFWSVVMSLLFF